MMPSSKEIDMVSKFTWKRLCTIAYFNSGVHTCFMLDTWTWAARNMDEFSPQAHR